MDKKGQTLVEFVIILPVFLIILFYIIDFGRIIHQKNKLENSLNDAVFLIKNGSDMTSFTKELGKNTHIDIKDDTTYKKVTITSSVDLIAPGFNLVLSNPYQVSVSRVIYDETE